MASPGERLDPFLGFRFEIRIDGLAVGGFSDIAGLQMETEVQDYLEGGFNMHARKFPKRTKQGNLTFKRGIVDRSVHDWYTDLVEGRVVRRGGSILVFDETGRTVGVEWQFRDAFPCKWVGPDLAALQGNVAVETLELCHQGLTRRK